MSLLNCASSEPPPPGVCLDRNAVRRKLGGRWKPVHKGANALKTASMSPASSSVLRRRSLSVVVNRLVTSCYMLAWLAPATHAPRRIMRDGRYSSFVGHALAVPHMCEEVALKGKVPQGDAAGMSVRVVESLRLGYQPRTGVARTVAGSAQFDRDDPEELISAFSRSPSAGVAHLERHHQVLHGERDILALRSKAGPRASPLRLRIQ